MIRPWSIYKTIDMFGNKSACPMEKGHAFFIYHPTEAATILTCHLWNYANIYLYKDVFESIVTGRMFMPSEWHTRNTILHVRFGR